MGITAARDLLLTQFESAAASEPVLDTEKRMDAHQLGAIPVRGDQGRMTSVLTRRTLADLRREDVDLTSLSAGDVARPITPVQGSESLEAVLESLRVQQVGRLPVMDDDVELGIITRGDILGYLDIKERLGPKIDDLVVDVSPNDEMFRGNVVAYLANGVSAVEAVKRAQAAVGKETPGSILDFACGHGRVLRALKAEFPGASLAACDVNADGVQFCARTFGARPLLSHRDPRQIDLHGEFDLVWCASLLTHLDARLWSPFLSLFESVLKPSGLLVFTVLGRAGTSELSRTFRGTPGEEDRVRTVLGGYETRGFGYSDYWRQSGYGLSLCTPEWVAHTLATQDRLQLLHHEEGALMGSQDIVACQATD